MQLVDVYRARIVDVAPDSLMVEVTGTEDKIDSLLDVLRPYGVLEAVRTGRVAMARGGARTPRARRPSAALRGPMPRVHDRRRARGAAVRLTRVNRRRPRNKTQTRRPSTDGHDLLRQGRRPRPHPSPQGGDHRLRIAGPRARAEPARQRRDRARRPARRTAGRARRPRPQGLDGDERRRGRGLGRRHHAARARHQAAGDLRGRPSSRTSRPARC